METKSAPQAKYEAQKLCKNSARWKSRQGRLDNDENLNLRQSKSKIIKTLICRL